MTVRVMTVAMLVACASGMASAQKQTDAERAAALVVHWQQIVYPAFEDARASIDEENSDHLNAVLSQGAVRVVQDHVDAPGEKKSDQAAGRLAAAIVKAAARQPGGSLIIDADAFEKALDAVCPLYPFCGR
jgi:predicted methyltransferase